MGIRAFRMISFRNQEAKVWADLKCHGILCFHLFNSMHKYSLTLTLTIIHHYIDLIMQQEHFMGQPAVMFSPENSAME